jgi:hypothetical protein
MNQYDLPHKTLFLAISPQWKHFSSPTNGYESSGTHNVFA